MKSARVLATALLLVIVLTPFTALVAAQAQEKGPAADRIIWKRVTLEAVVEALRTGEIDVYLFGLRPAAAQQLVGERGIALYQAPAGLVDLGLNPAPVMIVQLPGELGKKEAAARLGVDPVVIAYATYIAPGEQPPERFVGIAIEDRDVTIVELCAKIPEDRVVAAGGKVLWASDKVDFNPFCFREVRFALNYIVDRDYIIKNIYKGLAIARYAVYGAGDPNYVDVIDIIAKYKFIYNPALAKSIVFDVFERAGAEFREGVWYYNGKPVQVIGIIRIEDERYDIGNLFADALEKELGIKVLRQFLPFGEAITKVYATDPKDFEWMFYTEGWGRVAIDRWDPWMVIQFGAPWLGWTPGWGEPTYWNYRNDTIDEITKPLGLGGFKSKEEFIERLRKGTELVLLESLRIWVASVLDTHPARAEVTGVTLDLGAGLRNPFFLRGATTPTGVLKVGHMWVFTARTVWNPYGGFDDVYSVDPSLATRDPLIWRHPFNGEPIPFRVDYTVETAGPEGKLEVPADAVWWDAENDRWVPAHELGRTEATSKVVFDLSKLVGGKWHDGEPITMADILAAAATQLEIAYDPEKSQIEAAIASVAREVYDKIVALRFLPEENKVEVYLNFWHFDPNYIADMAVGILAVDFSVDIPLTIMFASDYLAFVEKSYALDETRAKKEGIPQLNLVLRDHAEDVKRALQTISLSDYIGFVTLPGVGPLITEEEWADRVSKAIAFIDEYGHAWISNGPFKLVRFDKDAQELELEAFRDPTYPFGPRDWIFGVPTPVSITGVRVPLVQPGKEATIVVTVAGPPPLKVKYVLRDPVANVIIDVGDAVESPAGFLIELPAELTAKLEEYAVYELTIIAFSESVALPAEETVTLQTVERVGAVEEVVRAQVEALRAEIERRMEELRAVMGEEVARTIGEAIGRLAEEVGRQLGGLAQRVEELGTAVERAPTKEDVAKVGEAVEEAIARAESAAGTANLAVILSAINLILLLVVLYAVFARRGGS
jgi:peptide/nickel transport system substrate-binding protein